MCSDFVKMNLKRFLSSLICCHCEDREVKIERECFENSERLFRNQKNMCTCAAFEHTVESKMKEIPPTEGYFAMEWFRNKCERSRAIWKYLLDEQDADLKRVNPYLIQMNKDGPFWRSLNTDVRNFLEEWKRLANLTILDIFHYRKRMQPRSQRLKERLCRHFTQTSLEFEVVQKESYPFVLSKPSKRSKKHRRIKRISCK